MADSKYSLSPQILSLQHPKISFLETKLSDRQNKKSSILWSEHLKPTKIIQSKETL